VVAEGRKEAAAAPRSRRHRGWPRWRRRSKHRRATKPPTPRLAAVEAAEQALKLRVWEGGGGVEARRRRDLAGDEISPELAVGGLRGRLEGGGGPAVGGGLGRAGRRGGARATGRGWRKQAVGSALEAGALVEAWQDGAVAGGSREGRGRSVRHIQEMPL
jgi:hypothetical protein